MAQDRLVRRLVEPCYEAVPEVAVRGEFARRGGIVDCFPPGQPLPVRIEWLGDEAEPVRAFDPPHQRRGGRDPGAGSRPREASPSAPRSAISASRAIQASRSPEAIARAAAKNDLAPWGIAA